MTAIGRPPHTFPLLGLSIGRRDLSDRAGRRIHVEELLGRFITTPHKAKHLLVGIRKLVYVALRQDWIEIDPTAAVEWRPAYAGWKAWSREAMAQFESRWPLGTAARTCYGLALWLGNRRGDVAGLRWDQRGTRRVFIDSVERHFDGFDIVQAKNKGRTGGKRLFVPIPPMLSRSWMRPTDVARPSWLTAMVSLSPPSR